MLTSMMNTRNNRVCCLNWTSKRRVTVCMLLWTFVFLVYFMWTLDTVPPELLVHPCKIDTLDPWDESLKPFIHPPPGIPCMDKYDLFHIDKLGRVDINKTMAKIHGVDAGSLKCLYQVVTRRDGDKEVVFSDDIELTVPAIVNSHVIRVKCTHSRGDIVYDMVHFNPVFNEDAKPDTDVETEGPDKLSVILFGIDSVARSHAIRNLPKSLAFLKNEFNAYDFKGYRKVGENTWPNLGPMLTGKSHRDRALTWVRHADSMPLLWYEQPVKHIASFFAEDRPDISSFGLGTAGFDKVPTDYFFRPYTLAMNEFEPVFLKPLGKPTWYCYGKRNYFDLQIEYFKGFLTKYKKKRKLAVFWSNEAAHEDFTTLKREDDPLLEFLQWLENSDNLKNSILFLLSDHGFRIGGPSLTHIGRAENNRPWLNMYVPKHVLTKHPWLNQTLVDNTERLVTAYDIHNTIVKILHNNVLSIKPEPSVSRSLVKRNMFSAIPRERTCADAGIEEKYCTCIAKINVSSSNSLANALGEALVTSVNVILKNYSKQCIEVRLHNITEVSVIYSNSDELNIPEQLKTMPKEGIFTKWFGGKKDDDFSGRYTVLFYTLPGYAYFEGTVDYAQYASKSNKLTVVGEPSRLNKYGTQSHCMSTSFLKQFCYCTIQL